MGTGSSTKTKLALGRAIEVVTGQSAALGRMVFAGLLMVEFLTPL